MHVPSPFHYILVTVTKNPFKQKEVIESHWQINVNIIRRPFTLFTSGEPCT